MMVFYEAAAVCGEPAGMWSIAATVARDCSKGLYLECL